MLPKAQLDPLAASLLRLLRLCILVLHCVLQTVAWPSPLFVSTICHCRNCGTLDAKKLRLTHVAKLRNKRS